MHAALVDVPAMAVDMCASHRSDPQDPILLRDSHSSRDSHFRRHLVITAHKQ